MAYINNQVYWVGQDGNVYLKNGSGVSSQGKYLGGTAGGFDAKNFSAEATRIDDPNPPKQAPPSPGPNLPPSGQGSGSGSGSGKIAPTAAQVAEPLASLASLGNVLANKNAQTNAEYQRTLQGYNAQDALDSQAHDKNVQQNEQTYTGNNQAALLNATNGASGLRGSLSSLGALAGSGMDIVRKLVGLAANSDTGASRKNFETNSTNVNQAWNNADQLAKQRREDAVSTRDNNLQNNNANVLTSKQSIYNTLANLYGSGTSEGNDYGAKAAALAAPIAGTTKASVAPYQKASSLFSPAALQQYLAGTQNLNVATDGGTPINSPGYAPSTKRDKLAGVA